MFKDKRGKFCVGVDNIPCSFAMVCNTEDAAEVGRAILTNGKRKRCILCDIPRLHDACHDIKARGIIMKRLSQFNRGMAELCIFQRVPDQYRVEFATRILYGKEKMLFDEGRDDSTFYGTVHSAVLMHWAANRASDNKLFRSAPQGIVHTGACKRLNASSGQPIMVEESHDKMESINDNVEMA